MGTHTHNLYLHMVSNTVSACLSVCVCPVLQVYVATFAVSAYASSYHRAGSKPFNPVLGETYECDRPDKGFRFLAEQVNRN